MLVNILFQKSKIIFRLSVFLWLTSYSFITQSMPKKNALLPLSNKKVIDIEYLKEKYEGETEFTLDLLREYFNSCKISVPELINAYRKEDWRKVHDMLYSLFGASLEVCADEMAIILEDMHRYFMENNKINMDLTIKKIPLAFERIKDSIEK